MKAFQLRKTSGIDALVLRNDVEQPEPGPDEVLIHVRANSLNFRDFMVARGQYPAAIKPGVIPLSDGAGDVVAAGKKVSTTKVGDCVVGSVFPDWVSGPLTQEIFERSLGGPLDGMLAEYVVLPERAVIPYPEHLSYEEAATLPNAGGDRLACAGGIGANPRWSDGFAVGHGRGLHICFAVRQVA